MYLFIEEELSDYKTVGYVLRALLASDDPEVYVYVNSEGGDYAAGLYIYEALRLSGKKIITHATGIVNSAAMLVYLAGDERYAHDYSSFMIHEIKEIDDEEEGRSAKYRKASSEELEHDNERMFSLIAERCKLTKKRIRKEVLKAPGEDWIFDSTAAKRFGIVHKIGFPRNGILQTPGNCPTMTLLENHHHAPKLT